ncbi:MAG: rhomboid family intramembrane serine protease [Phycisphaerales bacterium]|nr:rhomboid family intramembrane serine protease [Phycisphaerales bacterium]
MLIPIGTDVRPRRPPVGNYVLIALNIAMFVFTDFLGAETGQRLKALYTLDAARPLLFQYITYQFLHGDVGHLIGNMLFLWIFGNAVCDRMGALGYWLFYLSGGIFAGVIFSNGADNPILGASGAIAAVTTAFLVLYPRVHVTLFLWILVFMTTFQVPALLLIVFKIILWDNVIAPSFGGAAYSNVAYEAHLAGYAFGFIVPLLLLASQALPRNQFDALALLNRWRRRHGLPDPLEFARHAPTARPVENQEMRSRPLRDVAPSPVEAQRLAVLARLDAGDLGGAAEAYAALLTLDPLQALPRMRHLDLARYFMEQQRFQEAVATYEAYLAAYPTAADASQVRLLVGLTCNRYLGDYERAARHLRDAIAGLTTPAHQAHAAEELRLAEERLATGW